MGQFYDSSYKKYREGSPPGVGCGRRTETAAARGRQTVMLSRIAANRFSPIPLTFCTSSIE